MLLSGGVDSTVCTALLHKALGPDRVVAVHIDNGFMRKNESSAVEASLAAVGLKVNVINASHQFMNGHTVIDDKKTPLLCHVTDPETKRKIIGDTFMNVANRIIEDMKLDPDKVILGQGTLRPDLIESASDLATVGGAEASCIKTHHNDTQLVRQLRKLGKVVEPLKDFHKDEVRQIGRELGLSSDLVDRHPFPGPGLAIRVLCSTGEISVDRDWSEVQVLARLVVTYRSQIFSLLICFTPFFDGCRDALVKEHALCNRVEAVTSEVERAELSERSGRHKYLATVLPIRLRQESQTLASRGFISGRLVFRETRGAIATPLPSAAAVSPTGRTWCTSPRSCRGSATTSTGSASCSVAPWSTRCWSSPPPSSPRL